VHLSLRSKKVKELSVGIGESGEEGKRKMLERCASTALNSKLISQHQDFFAPMVVDAISSLDETLDIKMVGVKKVPGGSVTDSFLVGGVAFKKTFSYAGFEQQPKRFINPKILVLNVELELKSEKENAEIRISDPKQYQSVVDAEWSIIYEKLEACVNTGAKVILSKLPIGDLATQYFADRGLFCAGRVAQEDVDRTCRATGAVIQTSTSSMNESLGECGDFVEQQVGDERYNLFTGCPKAKTATIVLRGGSEQFIEESHRSVHDALMIVKRCIASNMVVVSGGGAIEMEVAAYLRDYARTIEGKAQMIMTAFAKALEVIPRQLSDNAGFDATDILNKLRQVHFTKNGQGDDAGRWMGVDVNVEGIVDTYKTYVWEPAANKINSLASATEAACMILSIDETVRNPKSEQPGQQGMGGMGGRTSAAMGGGGMRGMMGAAMGGGGGRGVRAFRGRGGA